MKVVFPLLLVGLFNADNIAFISLVMTTALGFIQARQAKKQAKRQEEQDEINEKFQEFQKSFSIYQQKTNELQFQLENRSNLIPYFHLNRTKSRTYYGENNQLIVEIHLTNVGRGTATNIMTCPMKNESTGEDIYFKQDPFMGKDTHTLYEYFNENFAIPNESVFLSLSKKDEKEKDENEKQLYFIRFKIKYSDAIGREYEQEFRFGYDNYLVKGINMNSETHSPKLVKDINE